MALLPRRRPGVLLGAVLLAPVLLGATACTSGGSAAGASSPAPAPSDSPSDEPPQDPGEVVGGDEDASSEGMSVAEPGPACTPAPRVRADLPADFPAGLELPARTVLTGVDASAGSTVVSGRVRASVQDVLVHFRTAVERAGLVVQREESEGRSGELVFFGAEAEGGVRVAKLSCPAGSTSFTVRASRTGNG